MSNRVDLSSNGSSSSQASQEFVKGLVEQGSFTQSSGADDAGGGQKADGKGKGKTSNAAKLTAPKAPPVEAKQVDRVDANSSGGGAPNALRSGGSLNIGVDANHAGKQAAEVGELAAANSPPATDAPAASGAASNVPVSVDKDPKIAAAQVKLAKDMNDPSVSQDQLQRDVKNLIDVTKKQGRESDTLQVINNAIPAGTSASKSGAIWEMAAKAGVDLDNNASKFKALKSDAVVNKALRDQQKATQAAAAQASAGKAQGSGGGGSGGSSGASHASGGSGSSGPSSWNGQKASASSATNDTSSAGGSQMSYSGPAENFPNDPGKWASWDDLWGKAAGSMAGTNTPEQISWIQAGIEKEAAATGIDKRFILAVVMQESGGNVNVGTTNNGVNNPGLMQSHDGASFDGSEASVMQMIKDGVEGTSSGDGLVQGLQQTGNLFAAARLYNSGQMDASNLSNAMGATASYCADLANFVMGRA